MASHAAAFRLRGRQGRRRLIRLNGPERKNPLTFDSYAELRDTFRALPYATMSMPCHPRLNGGNFSSGGDVHDIIGPLWRWG